VRAESENGATGKSDIEHVVIGSLADVPSAVATALCAVSNPYFRGSLLGMHFLESLPVPLFKSLFPSL
jgi:hypothetical protein